MCQYSELEILLSSRVLICPFIEAPGTATKQNEVMEAARRQIENRKKLLKNLSGKEIAKVANIQTLSADGLAKAKRAAELQARITNALARKTPGSLGLAAGPQAVILGSDGQRIDAVTGDIIEFRKATPSVLANQNVQGKFSCSIQMGWVKSNTVFR